MPISLDERIDRILGDVVGDASIDSQREQYYPPSQTPAQYGCKVAHHRWMVAVRCGLRKGSSTIGAIVSHREPSHRQKTVFARGTGMNGRAKIEALCRRAGIDPAPIRPEFEDQHP